MVEANDSNDTATIERKIIAPWKGRTFSPETVFTTIASGGNNLIVAGYNKYVKLIVYFVMHTDCRNVISVVKISGRGRHMA